VIMLSTIFMLL